jgi:hypothetical protein
MGEGSRSRRQLRIVTAHPGTGCERERKLHLWIPAPSRGARGSSVAGAMADRQCTLPAMGPIRSENEALPGRAEIHSVGLSFVVTFNWR